MVELIEKREILKLLPKLPIIQELLELKDKTAYLVNIGEEFLFNNYKLGLALWKFEVDPGLSPIENGKRVIRAIRKIIEQT